MRFRILWSFGTALVLAASVACEEQRQITSLGAEKFQAALLGANEVPAVTTTATGAAVFAVAEDTFLIYRIDVVGVDSPTVAHIHEGATGVPGSVIVTLYSGPTRGLAYSGVLGVSQLRASRLTQLPAGYGATERARFDSLLVLMRTGNVYVNVHTRRNPGGELRGQVQLR